MCARQCYVHLRSITRDTVDGYVAPHCVHGITDDRQPESYAWEPTRPVLIDTVEWIENALKVLLRYANSAVLYRYPHLVIGGNSSDVDYSFGSELDRVGDEIQKYLPQLVGIGHRHETGLAVAYLKLQVFSCNLGSDDRLDRGERSIDSHRLKRERKPSCF